MRWCLFWTTQAQTRVRHGIMKTSDNDLPYYLFTYFQLGPDYRVRLTIVRYREHIATLAPIYLMVVDKSREQLLKY